MSGRVFGLGVGPGDPDLITVKALMLLRAAAVVAYPAPEIGASFARSIVGRWISPAQIELPMRIPLDGARYPAAAVYDAAAAAIAAHLAADRDVAVLCQGDPFFYGSFMYLFARLAERNHVQVVPGVSSLSAAAAAARWPLAAHAETIAIVPALLEDEALAARLALADAAAIIKVGRHFARVRDLLTRLGLAGKACYIAHASLARERVQPLDQVAPDSVPYFSMILLRRRGEAAR
jgi:precorrin-2/cobalt-factor-2 C20-methyltransferase